MGGSDGRKRGGRRKVSAVLAALAVGGLAAAGAFLAGRGGDTGDLWPVARVPLEEYVTEAGDPVEVAAAGQLPSFLVGAPAYVRSAYQFALMNPDKLRYIPCYCGCARMGHGSNLSCYVARDERAQGRVAWNQHGLHCDMCLDITHDVMKGLARGKSLQQIRDEIDRKYGPGGDVPTPSPYPGSS